MTRLPIMAFLPWLAAAGLLAQAGAAVPQAGKRFALVIGNSNYPGPPIPGAADAHDIAASLDAVGFNVVGGTSSEKAVLDANVDAMTNGLKALAKAITDSGSVPEVVLFYFSGHGFQFNGANYLLPSGTSDLTDLKSQVISLEDVISTYMAVGDVFPRFASKIVILDACRSNVDLRIGGQAPPQGLTQNHFQPPPLTMVFYATAYGAVADGTPIAGHSPFTHSILLYISAAGLELSEFMTSVVADTQNHTRPQQIPTPYGSIPSPFFFKPPVEIEVAIKEVDDGVFVQAGNNEVARWIDEPEVRKTFYLRSGKNPLSIMVFNQKTYRNGQSWSKPEGWAYRVELIIPGMPVRSFANSEPVPRKNGPRFGKLFPVATATLTVNPKSSEVSVDDPWEIVLPPAENEDHVLYQIQVPILNKSLVIGGRESLRDNVNKCVGNPLEGSGRVAELFAMAAASVIQGKSLDDVVKNFNDNFTQCVGDAVWTELE
jgi:hypothetical protein